MAKSNGTPAAPASRAERLVRALRRSALFRELVPMEAGVGWPLPHLSNGSVHAILPCFGMARVGKPARTALLAPFAGFTVSWSSGRPVEYVDYRYRGAWRNLDFSRPLGSFPHEQVQAMRRSDYLAKRARLHRMYGQLFDSLAAGGELPPFWMREFTELVDLLWEPALRPFYRQLAPRFYARLTGSSP